MLHKTHIIIGFTVGESISIGLNLSLQDSIFLVMIVVIASILPDIDEPRSKISRSIPSAIPFYINKIFGHRGLTHNIAGLGIFSGLFSILLYLSSGEFSYLYLSAFIIGYITHIVCDLVTYAGISKLWFFNRGFTKIFKRGFLVGSVTEAKIYLFFLWSHIFFIVSIITYQYYQ